MTVITEMFNMVMTINSSDVIYPQDLSVLHNVY